MSLMGTITTGCKPEGVRVVIAGNEKMGKTTLTCDAPNPLLIPMEIGYTGITIPKTQFVQTFEEVDALLDEIIAMVQAGNFPYKSLILDSATALERHIHNKIIQMDPLYGKNNAKAVTMESALGGYGKAYTHANNIFDNFLKKCDWLAVCGNINIILTCHVFAAKIVDPVSGEYDSWDLLLHSPKNQKTYGKREIVTQWADIIGYLYEPIFVTKGENMSQGVSANKGRVLGLSRTPAYTAGNRFGVQGEIPIPQTDGWNHVAGAVYATSGIDIYKRDPVAAQPAQAEGQQASTVQQAQ